MHCSSFKGIGRDLSNALDFDPTRPAKATKSRPTTRNTVTRILGILRLLRAGAEICGIDEAWQEFKLSPDEYTELSQRIELVDGLREWYDTKCRYDYDDTHYILRMPTTVHELLICGVEKKLMSAIRELSFSLQDTLPSAAAALRNVSLGGSPSSVFFPPQLENSSQETARSAKEPVEVKRCLDSTFYYHTSISESSAENAAEIEEATIYPMLVLEVAHSQTGKSLQQLAESYIIDSAHGIRCVLGLKLGYQTPRSKNTTGNSTRSSSQTVREADKSATLSLWRPGIEGGEDAEDDRVGICETVLDAVPFRDAVGRACEGALQLTLSDLLPAAIFSSLASAAPTLTQHHLSIPFPFLTTLLNEAEARHNAVARHSALLSSITAVRSTLGTPRKFRKRKRTPSESLSEGREQAFVQQEQAERAREEALDETWQAQEVAVERRRHRHRNSGSSTG